MRVVHRPAHAVGVADPAVHLADRRVPRRHLVEGAARAERGQRRDRQLVEGGGLPVVHRPAAPGQERARGVVVGEERRGGRKLVAAGPEGSGGFEAVVRTSSPTQALIAEGVMVWTVLHALPVCSSEIGGKNIPPLNRRRTRGEGSGRKVAKASTRPTRARRLAASGSASRLTWRCAPRISVSFASTTSDAWPRDKTLRPPLARAPYRVFPKPPSSHDTSSLPRAARRSRTSPSAGGPPPPRRPGRTRGRRHEKCDGHGRSAQRMPSYPHQHVKGGRGCQRNGKSRSERSRRDPLSWTGAAGPAS